MKVGDDDVARPAGELDDFNGDTVNVATLAYERATAVGALGIVSR